MNKYKLIIIVFNLIIFQISYSQKRIKYEKIEELNYSEQKNEVVKVKTIGKIINGQKEGKFISYLYNNKKIIIGTCYYTNGNLNGQCIQYYPNGKVYVISNINDDSFICTTMYDTLGNLYMTQFYEKNLMSDYIFTLSNSTLTGVGIRYNNEDYTYDEKKKLFIKDN